MNFKIVKIDYEYCNYLRRFDAKVVYNFGRKELRPFVGILFNIGQLEYFAPLTSPKAKHQKMKNSIDFMKIDNGLKGCINFNNMIPVNKENYKEINLNVLAKTLEDAKYQKLLKEQLAWLNAHFIQVRKKAIKLYNFYINDKLPNEVKLRCCNFKLLEEKSLEYKLSMVH